MPYQNSDAPQAGVILDHFAGLPEHHTNPEASSPRPMREDSSKRRANHCALLLRPWIRAHSLLLSHPFARRLGPWLMARHGRQPLWPASPIQWVACARAVATSPEAREPGWRRWPGPTVLLSMLEINSIVHKNHLVESYSHSSCPYRWDQNLRCNVNVCVLRIGVAFCRGTYCPCREPQTSSRKEGSAALH